MNREMTKIEDLYVELAIESKRRGRPPKPKTGDVYLDAPTEKRKRGRKPIPDDQKKCNDPAAISKYCKDYYQRKKANAETCTICGCKIMGKKHNETKKHLFAQLLKESLKE